MFSHPLSAALLTLSDAERVTVFQKALQRGYSNVCSLLPVVGISISLPLLFSTTCSVLCEWALTQSTENHLSSSDLTEALN